MLVRNLVLVAELINKSCSPCVWLSLCCFVQVRFVVLDEADQMLDMGFQEDMEVILQQVRRGSRPAPTPSWEQQLGA